MKDALIAMFKQADHDEGPPSSVSAADMLRRGAERLDALPAGSPARTELAAVLIELHNTLALLPQAVALAEGELGAPPQLSKVDDAAHLRILTGWASAMYSQDLGAQALPVLRRAIERYPDREASELTNAIQVKGQIEVALGRFGDAAKSDSQALARYRRILPDGDPHVVTARGELAAALVGIRQGRRGLAEAERALADMPRRDTRLRAWILTMVGLRRALFGDFAGAEAAYAEADAIGRRLGYLAVNGFLLSSRAINALDRGDLAQARAMANQALAQQRSTSGDDSATRLIDLLTLRAEVAMAEGEHADAAAWLADAGTLARRGKLTKWATNAAALQAIALVHAGRLDEARAALDRIPQAAAGTAPEHTYAEAMALAARGVLHDAHGEPAAAITAFDRARAELAVARRYPAVLEDQLIENRDARRIDRWRADAVIAQASSASERSRRSNPRNVVGQPHADR